MDLQKARKDSKINDTSSSPVLNKVITGDSAPNHVLEAKQDSPIETTLADPNNTSEEGSARSPVLPAESSSSLIDELRSNPKSAPAPSLKQDRPPKRARASSAAADFERSVKLTTARRALLSLLPLTSVREPWAIPRLSTSPACVGKSPPVVIPNRTLNNAPPRPVIAGPSGISQPLVAVNSQTTPDGRQLLSRPTSPHPMMFPMSFDWILPVTATSNAEDSGVELCDSDNDVDDEAIDNDGLPEMIDTSAEEADLDDPHLPYLRGEEQDARGRFWWPRYPDPREFPARW